MLDVVALDAVALDAVALDPARTVAAALPFSPDRASFPFCPLTEMEDPLFSFFPFFVVEEPPFDPFSGTDEDSSSADRTRMKCVPCGGTTTTESGNNK